MPIPQELAAKLSALGISPDPDPSLAPWGEPPEPGPALRARMERLDLLKARQRLDAEGYSVIEGVFSEEECDRLAAAVRARTKVGAIKNMPLGNDPLFLTALASEKMMALAEAALGPGFLLMQYSATVLGQGGADILPAGVRCFGLHSDQPPA